MLDERFRANPGRPLTGQFWARANSVRASARRIRWGLLTDVLAVEAPLPGPFVAVFCVGEGLFVFHLGMPVPAIGLVSLERVTQVGMLLVFEPGCVHAPPASSRGNSHALAQICGINRHPISGCSR